MALIIDIGNSRIKICSWDGPWVIDGALTQESIPPLHDIFSWPRPENELETDAFCDAMGNFFSDQTQESLEHVGVVSTVPALTALVLLERPDAIVVDHKSSFPFSHSFLKIEEIGPDRFCNVAAAVGAGLSCALIVDAGTATTFDLLLDGEFKGGLIAPGMAFSAKMLGLKASLLEPVPFAACPLIVGDDTVSAMSAGGFHVGVQGVQGVIKGLLAEYGEMSVILTGGGARYLSHAGALYDPHWTQRGAAILAGFSSSS